jgi:hypothetical protein
MKPLPKKCTGDHPLVDVINRMIDCIEERTPLDGDTVKHDRTAHGFRPRAKIPKQQATGGGDVWL